MVAFSDENERNQIVNVCLVCGNHVKKKKKFNEIL